MQNHDKRQSPQPGPTHQESLQQTTLHAALTKLQSRGLDQRQVRRVAVERKGTLHFEVHEAGKQRFFVYQSNELRELQPVNDLKIPLVAKLHECDFEAQHTIISYRPGRRIVLGPRSGEFGDIVKGYKKHKAAQAAEKYAIALSACEHDGFDVPELLQIDTDNDCLVMAKQVGQAPEIKAGADYIWTGIGSHLQLFQRSPASGGLPEFSYLDELAVLDERERRFILCMPALPGRWQPGRERLEDAAMNLPPTVKGLAHRDLHDGQFIVAGKVISLLDFDLLCIADVALDAANLLAHMKLRTLQGQQQCGGSALSVCSHAFLRGLDRLEETGFEQRLLFYQATTYYRLALLYALRPRWVHLTGVLIIEGEKCIKAFKDLQGR